MYLGILFFFLFLNTHLGYSLILLLFITAQIMGGIPPPSIGIVGQNQSTRSKTTVRSKREVSPCSGGGPNLN